MKKIFSVVVMLSMVCLFGCKEIDQIRDEIKEYEQQYSSNDDEWNTYPTDMMERYVYHDFSRDEEKQVSPYVKYRQNRSGETRWYMIRTDCSIGTWHYFVNFSQYYKDHNMTIEFFDNSIVVTLADSSYWNPVTDEYDPDVYDYNLEVDDVMKDYIELINNIEIDTH